MTWVFDVIKSWWWPKGNLRDCSEPDSISAPASGAQRRWRCASPRSLIGYRWTTPLPLLALILALRGWLAHIPLGISAVMLPIIWHTAFGVFLMVSGLFYLHVRRIMSSAGTDRAAQGTQVRSELYDTLRLCLQVLIGFSAVFGVAITVIFTGGAAKLPQGVNPLIDPDLQATAVQMSFGFLCLRRPHVLLAGRAVFRYMKTPNG